MVGNSPTLILIKAHTNLIFGGFTSVPWECHEEEVDLPDESAFLFSVSKNTKHIPYQIFEDAVHHESLESEFIFGFDGEFDLNIKNNCNIFLEIDKNEYTNSFS